MNTRNRLGLPHADGRFADRREFLRRTGGGFGLLGLAGLLDQLRLLDRAAADTSAPESLAPRRGHFPARAKSVIWLFMYGGPSAVDLFDFKPELVKHDGKKLEGKGKIEAFAGSHGPLLRPQFEFRRHGQSGAWVSDAYQALPACVDDIAFIRSCYAESNNHAPALYQMNSGMTRIGFPSAGSWVTYGLGSENRDLPGFVVMYAAEGIPVGGAPLWGSGFLPGAYQGTTFRSSGSPILNLVPPPDLARDGQRAQLDLVDALNAEHRREHPAEPELLARIASFELAYRMQMEAPQAVDWRQEPDRVQKLYGLDRPHSRYFGTQLLLARRLVERGVRFIQVYDGGPGTDWDAHGNLKANHARNAARTDVPIAGLLRDLKQRGLLDSTLVVWGGEFGRLPVSQGGSGRDHGPPGFLMWMAGGGVKGGVSYGETDEVGFKAAVDPVSIHDIHATILHLLGLDHKKLTYQHNGRKFRLTDVAGEVLHKIIA